jgi:uncharacterized protein (TIGR02145 family)/uncharacterized repeat protein (TIGR02543 family)
MLCLTFATGAAAAIYTVTITGDGTNAVGAGSYAAGATVSVNAGQHPKGLPFKKWTVQKGGVKFGDERNEKTTFVMPERDVVLEAVFGGLGKKLEDGDDDPDKTTGKVKINGDDKEYTWVKIGNRRWITENLNYNTESGSVCFENNDANCEKYGRLYDWATAMGGDDVTNSTYWGGNEYQRQGICPAGFRLPNDGDRADLVAAAGGSTAGKALKAETDWADNYKGTDAFGFAALPGGYGTKNATTGTWSSWTKNNVQWWMTKEYVASNPTYAYYFGVSISNSVSSSMVNKIDGRSVRCVAYTKEKYAVKVERQEVETSEKTPGEEIALSVGTEPDGYKFLSWKVISGGVTINASTGKFIMPGNDVNIEAVYGKLYNVTIIGGIGDATETEKIAEGSVVTITAGPDNGRRFKMWSTQSAGVVFGNAGAKTTTFVMPKNDVAVEVKYYDSYKETFTDTRDISNPYTYGVVEIGNRKWLAENLQYANNGNSTCGGKDDPNCEQYGRYYNWTQAMGLDAKYNDAMWSSEDGYVNRQGVCPDGWHIPNYQEWGGLEIAAGGKEEAGYHLKTTFGWMGSSKINNGVDTYGFSALPGGYVNGGNRYNTSEGIWIENEESRSATSSYAAELWTAGMPENESHNSYLTGYRYGDSYSVNKTSAYSVRCVAYKDTLTLTIKDEGDGGKVTILDFKNDDEKEDKNGKKIVPGRKVEIMAGRVEDGSRKFKKWTIEKGVGSQTYPTKKTRLNMVLADPYSETTTLIMPEDSTVIIKAEYLPSFKDERDGNVYWKTTITEGGHTWMAENLNYSDEKVKPYCYGDAPENCVKYGGLYDWAAAMGENASYNDAKWDGNEFQHQGICPTGWHLPEKSEWEALAEAAESPENLRAEGAWGANAASDKTLFSALPGGGYLDGEYKSLGGGGYWWESTQYNGGWASAYYGQIGSGDADTDVGQEYGSKANRLSVRCVADWKVVVKKPTAETPKHVFDGRLKSAGIEENAAYKIENGDGTDADEYTATVSLIDKKSYVWDNAENKNDIADLELGWEIEKAEGTFEERVLSAVYENGRKLSDLNAQLAEDPRYVWDEKKINVEQVLYAGAGQKFDALFTSDKNHKAAEGKITVNVAKAKGLEVDPLPRELVIPASETGTQTFDLSTLNFNHDDHSLKDGKLVYTLVSVGYSNPSGVLAGVPTLGGDGGKTMSYKGGGKPSGTATQLITITSKNYEDAFVTIHFRATDATTYAVNVIGGEPDKDRHPKGAEVTIKATVPAAPGNEFDKWETSSAGVVIDDISKAIAKFTMPGGDVTVTAKTKPVSYTILFDANGGKLPGGAETGEGVTVPGTGKPASLPTPERDGYTFAKWYTEKENGVQVDKDYEFRGAGGTVFKVYARWTPKTFTVAWDADGGRPVPASSTVDYGAAIDKPSVDPALSCCEFDGWFTNAAKTDAAGFPITVKNNVTFYAKYKKNEYNVYWHYNGGDGGGIGILTGLSTVIHGGEITAKSAGTKEGYVFDAWYSGYTFTPGSKMTFPYGVESDLHLYANWKPAEEGTKNYTVKFDANGGAFAAGTKTEFLVPAGDKLASFPTPTLSGDYHFDGWYTAPVAGTKVTTSATFNANTTLFAQWKPLYLITFKAGDGATASKASDRTGADGKLASLPTATKSGYTFNGWFTSSSGGEKITSGTEFTSNTEVYAQWVIEVSVKYTITFNANGGFVSPSTGTTAGEGTLAVLPVPTRTNYAFAGWYTEKESGTRVTENTLFTSNTTIYAHWTQLYTVTFNADGGTVSPASAKTDADGKLAIDLPAPTKANSVFDGWYTAKTTGGLEVTESMVFTANTTIYAHWTQLYTITFNANGGTVSPASARAEVDGRLESLPKPARAGYDFDGWYSTSAATGGTEITESTAFTANTTIYARWTLLKYTITFDPNGGTVSVESGVTGAGGKLASLPIPAARTGYNFGGWYTSAESGTKVEASTVFTADVTIYARWTLISYTITYSLGGGTATPANPASYNIETPDITLNAPVRAAYTFDGWTGSNGTVKQTEVTIPQGGTGAKSYTANWTAVFYTITLDANGGKGLTTVSAKTAVGGKLSSLPTPTRDEHAFDGWYTESSGGVKVTTSTVFEEDATIYAQWWPVRKVTFDADGGTVLPASANTGAGGKLASLPTPAKKDYAFIGWYTGKDGGDKVTTATVFDDDATVYAHWSLFTDAAVTFSAGANGTLRVTVDNVPIASGASVKIGKDVAFTAIPNEGYKVAGWTINGVAGKDTSATYVEAGLSNVISVSVSFERRISVAAPNREIPSGATGEVVAIAPVKAMSGAMTLGPNPVKAGSVVAIYWTGGKAVSGKLSVFNAVGQKVAIVKVSGTKKIGTWKVGNIAEVTYLIKGVLTDKNGVRVVVSSLVGVVK